MKIEKQSPCSRETEGPLYLQAQLLRTRKELVIGRLGPMAYDNARSTTAKEAELGKESKCRVREGLK